MKRFSISCLACAILVLVPSALKAEAPETTISPAIDLSVYEDADYEWVGAYAELRPMLLATVSPNQRRTGSGTSAEQTLVALRPLRRTQYMFVSGPRIPQPPVRTVVPPRPETDRPYDGVTWVQVDLRDAPPPVQESPRVVSVTSQTEPDTHEVSIRVVITVNGEEYVIEIPHATVGEVVHALRATSVPTIAAPAPPRVALTPAPDARPAAPREQATPQPLPMPTPRANRSPAVIYPRNYTPAAAGVYRVQVGAFARTALAESSSDRLRTAGFTPRFEIFECRNRGRLYRVVVSGVRAAEIPAVAQRLGNAGFETAWIRREN